MYFFAFCKVSYIRKRCIATNIDMNLTIVDLCCPFLCYDVPALVNIKQPIKKVLTFLIAVQRATVWSWTVLEHALVSPCEQTWMLRSNIRTFSATHHDLHGGPPGRPPVHGHAIVDHMCHCPHYLCRDTHKTIHMAVTVIVHNWTVDGATVPYSILPERQINITHYQIKDIYWLCCLEYLYIYDN